MLSYFGWVRTHALFNYFGIDSRVLGLSTTDYLQSTFSLAIPVLIYGGLIGLVLIGGAVLLADPVARRPRLALSVTVLIGVLGSAFCVLGVLAIRGYNELRLTAALEPLELGLGLLLLIGAARLAARSFARAPALSTAALATTLAVVACTVAWSWSLYASYVGVSGARELQDGLAQEQAISVTSVNRLALTGHGIVPVDLSGAGSIYKVRYDGLRLLAVGANGDLFLLPKNWLKGRDPVIVLKMNDNIRIDVVAPPKRKTT
jgi:hypothetical protein